MEEYGGIIVIDCNTQHSNSRKRESDQRLGIFLPQLDRINSGWLESVRSTQKPLTAFRALNQTIRNHEVLCCVYRHPRCSRLPGIGYWCPALYVLLIHILCQFNRRVDKRVFKALGQMYVFVNLWPWPSQLSSSSARTLKDLKCKSISFHLPLRSY